VTGVDGVTIAGGWFRVGTFSPKGSDLTYPTIGTSWANSYFYGGTGIYVSGSTNVTIDGARFDGYWTGVNVYNSSSVKVRRTEHNGGIAGIAVVSSTGAVTAVSITDNQILGCGDDGIAVLTRSTYDITDSIVANNRIDKSRLDGSVVSAVGVRVGQVAASSGVIRGLVVTSNVLSDMVTDGFYLHDLYDSVVSVNSVRGWSRGSAGAGSRAYVLGVGSGHGVYGTTLSGNIAVGGVSSSQAIEAVYMANSVVTGGRYVGNVGGGFGAVNLNYSTGNVISGVRAENALGSGIRCDAASTGNTVAGNDTSINSGTPISIPAGNYVSNNVGAVAFLSGSGDPSGAVSAVPGTVYQRTDGAAGTPTYVKRSGTGTSGWAALGSGRDFQTPGNGGTVTPALPGSVALTVGAATGGVTAFTVAAPSGASGAGQMLTIRSKNQNGASALTVTWNAVYHMNAFGTVATGFSRSVTFEWDDQASVWVEVSRSGDVPN
jgi:hypothetical protein